MRCRKIEKNLTAYLAGELSERDMERIGKHLETCTTCAREFAEIEKFHESLDRLEDVSPPPGFETQFWARVKEIKTVEPSIRWLPLPGPDWALRWKWALSTALVVLVVSGGYIGFQTRGFQTLTGQREPVSSVEITEIVKDLDFYKNYEVIEVIENLTKRENDETIPGEGNSSGEHTL